MKNCLMVFIVGLFAIGCRTQVKNTREVDIAPVPRLSVGFWTGLVPLANGGEGMWVEGHDFEWGVTSRIEVEDVVVENPPADGSSVRHLFVQLISTSSAPAGTEFSLDLSLFHDENHDRQILEGIRIGVFDGTCAAGNLSLRVGPSALPVTFDATSCAQLESTLTGDHLPTAIQFVLTGQPISAALLTAIVP